MRKLVASLGLLASLAAYSAFGVTTVTIKDKELQQSANADTLRRTLAHKFEQQVVDSTVCIRANTYYSQPMIDPLTGKVHEVLTKEGYHGTGNVVGKQIVNGNLEYIISTNNHVGMPAGFQADPKGGGPRTLLSEKMSLVDSAWDNDERDDIKLELFARDPDNEVAYMRTVNCKKKLQVIEPEYDFTGNVKQGEEIFSVGFPHGEGKTLQKGEITNTHFFDVSPYPHYVYTGRISIDPGQSGSNVYTVVFRKKKGTITAHLKLIGLIYAKNPKDDSTRMITPTPNFKEIVTSKRSIDSKRPKLNAPIDTATLDAILDGKDNASFDVFSRRYIIARKDDAYSIKEYVLENNILVPTMTLNTDIKLGMCGIEVERFTYEDEDKFHAMNVANFSPDAQQVINNSYTSMLNYFKDKKKLEKLQSNKYKDEKTSQLQEYYEWLDNQDMAPTYIQWYMTHSLLTKKGIIEDDFF